MSIELTPFTPEHLKEIQIQGPQLHIGVDQSPEMALQMMNLGYVVTAWGDGEIIGIFGCIYTHENKGFGWALISLSASRFMIPVTKAVIRYLDQCEYKRVETAVRTKWENAHRWARMLGFEREGTMKSWSPDGEDYDLYARIK